MPAASGWVGKTYVINLRLVDTEQAKTINTVNLNVPSVYTEDVLILKIKEAGLKLLELEAPEPMQKVDTTDSEEMGPKPQKSSGCLAGRSLEMISDIVGMCLGIVVIVGLIVFKLSLSDDENDNQDSLPDNSIP